MIFVETVERWDGQTELNCFPAANAEDSPSAHCPMRVSHNKVEQDVCDVPE